MRFKVRPQEEIKRKIDTLSQYQSSPFYQKAREILSWALDKTDREIVRRLVDLVRLIKKFPLDSKGQQVQVPNVRYEGLALLWLLGDEVQSISGLTNRSSDWIPPEGLF